MVYFKKCEFACCSVYVIEKQNYVSMIASHSSVLFYLDVVKTTLELSYI